MQCNRRTVLQLDIQGTPQAWISLEQAATHYASGTVAWEDGREPLAVLRGGTSVATGRQSRLEIAPIVALRGASRINLFDCVPTVTKRGLLVRDRMCCAYCGNTGYYRRTGVYEIMEVTPALKRLISKQASSAEIQSLAIKEGMHTLHTAAALYVLDGTTSIAEMLRITFDFEE